MNVDACWCKGPLTTATGAVGFRWIEFEARMKRHGNLWTELAVETIACRSFAELNDQTQIACTPLGFADLEFGRFRGLKPTALHQCRSATEEVRICCWLVEEHCLTEYGQAVAQVFFHSPLFFRREIVYGDGVTGKSRQSLFEQPTSELHGCAFPDRENVPGNLSVRASFHFGVTGDSRSGASKSGVTKLELGNEKT